MEIVVKITEDEKKEMLEKAIRDKMKISDEFTLNDSYISMGEFTFVINKEVKEDE